MTVLQDQNVGMPTRDLSALVGCDVRRVSFDYQVTLLLADGPYQYERVNATLTVEAPFRFRGPDAKWHAVQPGQVETLGPVLTLFGQTVQEATFDGDALTIGLGDASIIEVETSPIYKSWSLTGTGVPEIIAGPWDLADGDDTI